MNIIQNIRKWVETMTPMFESDLITDLDQTKESNQQLKAVQAARMSTLVLALLTTIITIISQ